MVLVSSKQQLTLTIPQPTKAEREAVARLHEKLARNRKIRDRFKQLREEKVSVDNSIQQIIDEQPENVLSFSAVRRLVYAG